MKNKLEKYRQIPEFSGIIDKMTEEEIEQSFSSSLSFGTSGVRGIIGIGTNKMNILNVIKIVSAASLYLKSIGKENVGISYDTRKNSKLFAEYSFYTLKHFGLKPKIFKDPTPTPVLSFALKKYFDLGINITASHNPGDYNGIKVMSEIGSQINERVSTPIAEFMDSIDEFEVYKNLKKCELDFIDDSVKQEYLDFCLKEVASFSKPKISVLYTNLCGVGRDYVKYVLEKRNFKVNFVQSQFEYDENFTTCPSPNPEFEIAFNEAKKQATGEDLIFATDPDGDRLGAMVKNGEGYRLLSGNEIGKILTYFLLTEKQVDGEKFVTTTVVTSRAIKKLARKFNAHYYETLTGFKNIASKVEEESKDKISLIFFEESCGYEVTGLLRDKDGITAGLLLVEIANFYAHQNKTLLEVLEEINTLTDYEVEISKSYYLTQEKMLSILNNIRDNNIDIDIIDMVDYLDSKKTGLQKSNFIKLKINLGEIIIRPSGTEPKLKVYTFASGNNTKDAYQKCEQIIKLFEEKIM